ncbi:MAG: L-lactate MFS transporter [Thermosulfidibacteraceae bacterium]|jgi:MFS family permease
MGRWMYVVLGLIINVILGTVYAYSLFRPPLEKLWGISATESGLPYTIFLALIWVGMPLGAKLMRKYGSPRKPMIIGGVLTGIGYILAGFSPNIWFLTFAYGIVAGLGVWTVYGCPIATSTRWFPDKTGLAVGLTVGGFGLSAFITGPVIKTLIASVGPLSTFLYLGVAYLVLLILLSLPYKFPPEGYSPAPSATQAKPGTTQPTQAQVIEIPLSEASKTIQFWALYVAFAVGSLAGLLAIGTSAPVAKEVGVSSGLVTAAIQIFAVCNFIGRPLFGWLTDKITSKGTTMLSHTLIFLASLLLYMTRNTAGFIIGYMLLWLNLGGWLAIAPTSVRRFFGVKYAADIYGVVISAYGVGAIVGGLLSGRMKDITGSYINSMPVVAALAVVGFLCAFAMKPLTKKS